MSTIYSRPGAPRQLMMTVPPDLHPLLPLSAQ